MHETARSGLVRVLGGAAFLFAVVAAVLLLVRGCKSEEERLSDLVDEARDALVEHRAPDFLAYFDPDVRYRAKGTVKTLERDLERWNEFRAGRVSILDRTITVDGTKARIHLRCEVGAILRNGMIVGVDLEAERRDGAWRVVSFDWKNE